MGHGCGPLGSTFSGEHLPTERAAEAMGDLLGVEGSTGFLDDVYREGADALGPFLDEVQRHAGFSSSAL